MIRLKAFFLLVLAAGVTMTSAAVGQSRDSLINEIRKELDAANDLITRGINAKARELIQNADRRIDSLSTDELDLKLLSVYSGLYLREQKIDSSLMYTRAGLDLGGPDSVMMSFWNQMGTLLRIRSEYVESLESYSKAYNIARELKDQYSMIGILQNMAGSYQGIGQLDQAIEHFTEALSYARQEQDTTLLIVVTNNIGDVYNDQEEFLKAAIYLEESRALAEEAGYRDDLLRATTNLAISRANLDDFDEALSLYTEARMMHAEVRPNVPPFQIDYNMGEMYLRWGRPDSALKYYSLSLDACEKMGIPIGIFFNRMGLGKLYEEQGNTDSALQQFSMANEVAEEIGGLQEIEASSDRLYKIYKDNGDESNALRYFERKEEAADSLNTVSNRQAIAEMESRLELIRQQTINERLQAEREKQDTLLNTQKIIIIAGAIIVLMIIGIMIYVIRADRQVSQINKELRRQKDKLIEANREKDRLFAIIAHDMRSPLTSLQGFIYLLNNSDMSQEEVSEISKELEISVQKNLNLMKDLLTWAKDQMSGIKLNINNIDARSVIMEVTESSEIIAERKGIRLQNNTPREYLVRADRDSLEIVIRNLVVNALKFTERDGRVRIDVHHSNGTTVISVADNGIGIPDEIKETLFSKIYDSRKGTQGEKGSGFGLNLSYQLIKKMGGRLYFDSQEGIGTTFYVELKTAKVKEGSHIGKA